MMFIRLCSKKTLQKEKTDNEEGEGGDGGNGGEGGEGGEANDKGEGPGVTENKDEEIQEGQEGQNAGGEQVITQIKFINNNMQNTYILKMLCVSQRGVNGVIFDLAYMQEQHSL